MSDFESGSTTSFPAPLAASRMVVADFDGDGDADILFQTGANGTAFRYALNQGDGIHPNSEGSRVVERVIWKSLEPPLDSRE